MISIQTACALTFLNPATIILVILLIYLFPVLVPRRRGVAAVLTENCSYLISTNRIAHCIECGAKFGLAGGAARLSNVSPSCCGGSGSPSCSSVSPASESSSSGWVESPLSSSGYSSSEAMPVVMHDIIQIIYDIAQHQTTL